MKIKYQQPDIEVLKISATDILRTSTGTKSMAVERSGGLEITWSDFVG